VFASKISTPSVLSDQSDRERLLVITARNRFRYIIDFSAVNSVVIVSDSASINLNRLVVSVD
jgi:hypothetical protein